MDLKRFVVATKPDGEYVCTFYAEQFALYDGVNSFTGARGGHFYIGGQVVGSVELAKYTVADSGGVMFDADASAFA